VKRREFITLARAQGQASLSIAGHAHGSCVVFVGKHGAMNPAGRFLRAIMRKPSCLISCSHWPPEGSLSVLVGRHGAMNPVGRARTPNILPTVRDYSRASQSF
jgi:hypothetical protein